MPIFHLKWRAANFFLKKFKAWRVPLLRKKTPNLVKLRLQHTQEGANRLFPWKKDNAMQVLARRDSSAFGPKLSVPPFTWQSDLLYRYNRQIQHIVRRDVIDDFLFAYITQETHFESLQDRQEPRKKRRRKRRKNKQQKVLCDAAESATLWIHPSGILYMLRAANMRKKPGEWKRSCGFFHAPKSMTRRSRQRKKWKGKMKTLLLCGCETIQH